MKYFHLAFIAWGNFYNQNITKKKNPKTKIKGKKKKEGIHIKISSNQIFCLQQLVNQKRKKTLWPCCLSPQTTECPWKVSVTWGSAPKHTRGHWAGWDESPLPLPLIIIAVVITAAPEASKAKAKLQKLCPREVGFKQGAAGEFKMS